MEIYFHFIVIANRAGINIDVQAFLCYYVEKFGDIPHGKSTARLLRNIHSDFCNSCIRLHPRVNEYITFPLSPHQHLFSVIFLVWVILKGVIGNIM